MTWVKKTHSEWHPQEHPGIVLGDVVDFPGPVHKLVTEGNVALCDEQGNELSAYDAYGVVTDREMEEFRAYKEMQRQERLKKTLEKEHDTLLAEAEAIKAEKAPVAPVAAVETVATVEDARKELEDKKKAWGARMAAAREAKKAAVAGTV